jgi:hypothetical protein
MLSDLGQTSCYRDKASTSFRSSKFVNLCALLVVPVSRRNEDELSSYIFVTEAAH